MYFKAALPTASMVKLLKLMRATGNSEARQHQNVVPATIYGHRPGSAWTRPERMASRNDAKSLSFWSA